MHAYIDPNALTACMKYHINEGALTLPHPFEDRTMQVLMPLGSGIGLNLIVTRDPLEPGETVDDYLKRQLSDLRRQVAKYQESDRGRCFLGKPNDGMEGVYLELQYKQQGKFLYHLQGVFLMRDRQHVMSITGSASAPFTEAQRQAWHASVASFEPRL